MHLPKLKSDDKIKEWAKSKGFDISDYLDRLDRNIESMSRVDENDYENEQDYREALCDEDLWKDPDDYAVREIAGRLGCKADALHSCWRVSALGVKDDEGNILEYYKDKEDIMEFIKHYRKVPIFYFPSEGVGYNGINRNRSKPFNDRIDLLLFDLKNHIQNKHYNAVMKKFFEAEVNKDWIDKLNKLASKEVDEEGNKKYEDGFQYLVDKVYEVRGESLFVNKDFEVINIETGQPIKLEELDKVNNKGWTKTYFDNLATIIDNWYEEQRLLL